MNVIELLSLRGHEGSINSISTTSGHPYLLSGSKDKTMILWEITNSDDPTVGYARIDKQYRGHTHFIQDVALSLDGNYAVSTSWDRTIKLWSLANNETEPLRSYHGIDDVLSVTYSPDSSQIASGSRDKSICLWSTTSDELISRKSDAHSDWVTCVRYSPNTVFHHHLVSCGWDNLVKAWDFTNLNDPILTFQGHTDHVNNIAISPDGYLIASGGKDRLYFWDLNTGETLYSIEAGDVINSLCFNPSRYWIAIGTNSELRVFDLESKQMIVERNLNDKCQSVTWDTTGKTLFAACDNIIRCFQVGG